MKCYGKLGLIIQKRKHTLGFGVSCVKIINQILQETLANHGHVGLICTSEIIRPAGIFKENNIKINAWQMLISQMISINRFHFVLCTSSETTTEVSKCDFYINPRERGRIWQHEERNQPSIYY